jgi:hypothetical protein
LVGLLSAKDYAGYADEGRRLAVDVPNVTPMDAARFIAEATPIIGDAMAAKEIYDEATSENPNWALVGALGGAAVLGLFPGIGDAAAKAVKSGARGLLDTAKRVEVDPNAMGSLLGNVRLKPKGDAQDEITLFHGSPYDFRDFDLGQVGKGEGAQDLGRGFSLTDEEIVAHSYMNPASRWGDLGAMERYRQAGPGRTYEVAVKASPDQILDWKRPWKDQVPEGTPLYEKIQESMVKSYADDSEMQKLFQQANLSSAWRDDFGMEDAAIKSGFVGNKRKNFSGDTEFTIFDPSRMEMRKVFDNEGRQLPLSPPSPAEEIAGLLSSGRADEVTDEMLGKLTPNDNMELFELYQSGATGMDLPMDEASRMARAKGAGFEGGLFHGTGADIVGVDKSKLGEKQNLLGKGFYQTTSQSRPDRYIPRETDPQTQERVFSQGGNVLPLMSKSVSEFDLTQPTGAENALNIGKVFEGADFDVEYRGNGDQVFIKSKSDPKKTVYIDSYQDGLATVQKLKDTFGRNNVTNILEEAGFSGLRAAEGFNKSTKVNYNPEDVRSRFARFDPRLSNLKNLSAGVALPGAGLLALQEMQKRANEEQQRQGLLQ